MGDLITAKCPCGFASETVAIGCGFSGVSYSPCICTGCGSFRSEEYFASDGNSPRRVYCRKCRQRRHFLSEPGFYRPPDIEKHFDASDPWDIHNPPIWQKRLDSYPTVYYRCPKCGKLDMTFTECGLWD